MTRAVVQPAIVGRLRAKDDAQILERPAICRQHAAGDGRAVATLARLRVAQINRAIRFERGTQRDVEQPALPARVDRRHAADRLTDLPFGGNDAQAAGLFRHEQVAARQRLDGPRPLESSREHDHVERNVRLHCAGTRLPLRRPDADRRHSPRAFRREAQRSPCRDSCTIGRFEATCAPTRRQGSICIVTYLNSLRDLRSLHELTDGHKRTGPRLASGVPTRRGARAAIVLECRSLRDSGSVILINFIERIRLFLVAPFPPSYDRALQDKTFLLLLVLVTLAFGWILWPYFGAIFWAAILAILFTPMYRRLAVKMDGRRTLAALLTLSRSC